jgi:hypothetical protein
VKFNAVDGPPTTAKEVAVSSMEEQQQQLEAMILRNFLLVQADKHGHHLLASLPRIAGGDTPTGHQFPTHLTGIKVRQVPKGTVVLSSEIDRAKSGLIYL